jgi:drug/metabolite transporter (DMT)-like permease
MTSAARVRATPRLWAFAALAALVLLAAGLVQVVVGSREQLLQLLAGTVLSVAVVAATAWWAFTTRRLWKRWLNIAIAALAVANVLLGFVEFGYRQAAGALAIVAGALAYAAAARRALRPSTRWTAPRPPPSGRLRSPPGDPTAAGGAPARPVRRPAGPRGRGCW